MKMLFQIIIAVLVILLIIGTGHFVVYKNLITILNTTNSKVVNFLKLFFIVATFSFIITTLITQFSYSKIGSFCYQISAIWLGTLYFLFLASIVFALIFNLGLSFGIPATILRYTGSLLLISAILTSLYGLINSSQINVTNYTVPIENLPSSWENKKIVLFSDSHFGNINNLNFGKRIVDLINNQKPKVVLIAGDYYDGPPVNTKQVAGLMAKVKTEKGIYFTSGNHDEYGNHKKFLKSLEENGVHIIDNKSILVDGVLLVGIDYKSGSNDETINRIFGLIGLDKKTPKILIKHAPNHLAEVNNFLFSLVVSGHVHNGQIWPGPIIAKKIFKNFSYGLNYFNNMAVITSSGVGTWGPPQRVGTKSEIVVINLISK